MKTYCDRCKKEVEIIVSTNGPHLRADCYECRRFIKFLSRKDIGEKTIEKIKLIEDVFSASSTPREKVFLNLKGKKGPESVNARLVQR